MGLYNYFGYKLPSPLKEGCCVICNHPIVQIEGNGHIDGYEYKCINCNPRVIIVISGSLCASTRLYDILIENVNVKFKLKSLVQETTELRFLVGTQLISELNIN